MCFYADYDDYDWIAQVAETTEGVDVGKARCSECRHRILPGQWRRRVDMREREECRKCEEPEEYGECDGESHDYGEADTYFCCEVCETILAAIQAVEESEGCSGDSARPPQGQLRGDVHNGSGWLHYMDAAARVLPGVYLPWDRFLGDAPTDALVEDFSGYWCDECGHNVPAGADIGGEA